MNCTTSQRLIDRGVAPGAASPARTSLGFHLAGCANCRAYQQRAQDDLLATLLEAPSVRPPVRSPAPRQVPPIAGPRRRWRSLVAGVGIGMLLLILFALVPTVGALLRIRQNVQAYIISTAVSLPPTVAALAPVAAIVPSATPRRATPVPQPTGAGTASAALPSAAATPLVPTPRNLPTQTITPVPLDAILAVGRASNATPAPTQVGGAGVAPADVHGARTILLMGVDRRPGEAGGTRSDTIIIARLDPANQRIALLSLPRDLIVPIPGFGYARINAANAYGEQNPQLGGGLELTRQTVSNLLGTPIDNVIQVDFQGFIGAVDALGGVDLDVPTEIYDPEYPTMDYGYTIAHFLPGVQHMDGERALMYARTRHADSDIYRTRRQQAVLVSVLQRVRAQNTLQQLGSIADVTAALRGYIHTDLPEDQMINLAWTFRSLAPERVERYTLDENSFQIGVIPGDYYAIVAVPGAIDQLSSELINGPAR